MKIAVDIVNAVAAAFVAGIGLVALCCAAFAFSAAARRTLRNILSRMDRGRRIALLVLAAVLTIYGGSKNLKPRSSANEDAGIVLVAVTAVNTNGLTTIVATSTGEHAKPMWYRDSTTNDWTAATSDGFELVYSEYVVEAGVFSNVWTRAETNYAPRAAYFFGNDPPAIEVVSEGGLYMDAWHATGRGVDVAWRIDDGVVLTEGSRVILEYGFGPGNTWSSVASVEVLQGGDRSGTLSVQGWFVGFATRWRLKLEVPR